MKDIYIILGIAVFWGVVISTIAMLLNIFYKGVLKPIIKSDLVQYNLGKVMNTDILRSIYRDYGKAIKKRTLRYLLKYRLRNIKRARK